MAISSTELFSLCKRRYAEVPVPEIGAGKLARIQSLTEQEKADYEGKLFSTKDNRVLRDRILDARRRLLCLVLVDDDGNRLLGDDDVDKLKPLDGATLSRICDKAKTHCGFDETDIEDLLKNSGSVHVEDSQ